MCMRSFFFYLRTHRHIFLQSHRRDRLINILSSLCFTLTLSHTFRLASSPKTQVRSKRFAPIQVPRASRAHQNGSAKRPQIRFHLAASNRERSHMAR